MKVRKSPKLSRREALDFLPKRSIMLTPDESGRVLADFVGGQVQLTGYRMVPAKPSWRSIPKPKSSRLAMFIHRGNVESICLESGQLVIGFSWIAEYVLGKMKVPSWKLIPPAHPAHNYVLNKLVPFVTRDPSLMAFTSRDVNEQIVFYAPGHPSNISREDIQA